MDINITQLSDKEISDICIKYNIIQSSELQNHTRQQVVGEIQKWVQYKKETYRQRRHSSPNISANISANNQTKIRVHKVILKEVPHNL